MERYLFSSYKPSWRGLGQLHFYPRTPPAVPTHYTQFDKESFHSRHFQFTNHLTLSLHRLNFGQLSVAVRLNTCVRVQHIPLSVTVNSFTWSSSVLPDEYWVSIHIIGHVKFKVNLVNLDTSVFLRLK